MQTDTYTKFILTVIAVALIGNFFKDAPLVATANAQTPEITRVNIVQVGGLELKSHNNFPALPIYEEKAF